MLDTLSTPKICKLQRVQTYRKDNETKGRKVPILKGKGLASGEW
jgi:hypothetical protein